MGKIFQCSLVWPSVADWAGGMHAASQACLITLHQIKFRVNIATASQSQTG